MDVLRTDFHHVRLNGHDRLFREQFKFSKASTFFSERPSLTAEGTLDKLVPTSDLSLLQAIVDVTLSSIAQFLFMYPFDSAVERQDQIFLQHFLSCFLKEPHVALREIYFNGVKNKPLGQGKIDVIAGTLTNGNKPILRIKGTDRHINKIFLWLAAAVKVKEYRTPLYGSRMPPEQDLKALYQPITLLCSMSELCEAIDPSIPLIGLYGSRYSYRPLLYFREHDVLFTTSTPFTYFDSQQRIDLHGLVFLRVLAMLQDHPFANEVFIGSDKKLGWKDAREKCNADVFRGVSLSIEDDGVEDQNPNDMPPPIAPLSTSLKRAHSDSGKSSHKLPRTK